MPQAWAAGAVFHLVQALLGLRADAPRGRLYVDPHLPAWLPDLTLHDLWVGGAALTLHCWREGEATRWEVTDQQGELMVVEQPWGPWLVPEPAGAGTDSPQRHRERRREHGD